MEYSILSNNLKMPMVGFGVFKVTDKEECQQSVLSAIRSGYRLIDTAAVYGNEDAVGDAVREAIATGLCTREELFITSKLWVQDMANYDLAKAGIEASLKKSGLDYFDLYFAQPAALETMKHYNVQPEAWAPLGGGRHKPYENVMLQRIADGHQKTIAQVVLRWNVQRGVTVIPKSTRQERIEENFAIWDFSLTDNEMAQINALDLGYVGEAVKHFNPEFVRGCLGVKIHD
ncbi:aldo/keto reductase [Salmonella enterica subsp. enterica serovar Derby]|nr:aldo/keto reductase [Salmonella enterica subsp. enterica serovar Derby]